jgi:hypothetical protein
LPQYVCAVKGKQVEQRFAVTRVGRRRAFADDSFGELPAGSLAVNPGC